MSWVESLFHVIQGQTIEQFKNVKIDTLYDFFFGGQPVDFLKFIKTCVSSVAMLV